MSETSFATVPDERLEAELCQLAADLTAGTARWLGLVAEYDRRRVWEQWECRSMAQWLALHVGVSLITARQYVHVASVLEGFPLLREVFTSGRLSYSRVRALSRVITPTSERDLVEMALQATAPQLERFVAGVRRAQKLAGPCDREAQREGRGLSLSQDDDGSWVLRGRLPAEVGVAVQRALRMEMDRHRPPRGVVHPDPYAHRMVDALAVLVGQGHAVLEAGAGVVPARPLVVVHRYPDGDELEGGSALSAEHADGLSVDADWVEATHHGPGGDEEPRIVYSRRRRSPTESMRRFLRERDQGCRFPGCGIRRGLHAHHVEEYHLGGATTAKNLVMVCSFHHGVMHRNGWVITGLPDGRLSFGRPGMRPMPGPVDGDIERIVERAVEAFRPGSVGSPLHLDYAVSVFFDNEHVKAMQLHREEGAPP